MFENHLDVLKYVRRTFLWGVVCDICGTDVNRNVISALYAANFPFSDREQVPGQKHADRPPGRPDARDAVPGVRAGLGQLDRVQLLPAPPAAVRRHAEQPVRRGEDAGERRGVLLGRAAEQLAAHAPAGPDRRQLSGLRRVRRAGHRVGLPEDKKAAGGRETGTAAAARVLVLQTLLPARRRPRGRRGSAVQLVPFDNHRALTLVSRVHTTNFTDFETFGVLSRIVVLFCITKILKKIFEITLRRFQTRAC